MSQKQPGPGRANDNESKGNAGGEPGAGRGAPAPAAPGSDLGNTEPGTYREGDTWVRVLRFGVDSLYVSYQGAIDPGVEGQLLIGKQNSQSRDRSIRSRGQFEVEGHRFEVWDRGRPGFEYVLQDNAFRIFVASSLAPKMPLAYVAISSEFLAHKGAEGAVEELTPIVGLLGEGYQYPDPSRVDLCVDFQTNADLEAPGRKAWVGRARSVNSYSEDDKFTGWTIGQGSILSARLYEKSIEAIKTNKTWLYPLWKLGGADLGLPVWRLEFQVKRQVLLELGIRSFKSLLDNLGGIWQYAAQDWLRLTVPQAQDSNRRRWPVHPVWAKLAGLLWRLDDVPLSRSFSAERLPVLDRLYRLHMSFLTTFMAAEKITDYSEGMRAFLNAADHFQRDLCSQRYGSTLEEWIEKEVREKGKRFNTISNGEKSRKPGEDDAETGSDGAE